MPAPALSARPRLATATVNLWNDILLIVLGLPLRTIVPPPSRFTLTARLKPCVCFFVSTGRLCQGFDDDQPASAAADQRNVVTSIVARISFARSRRSSVRVHHLGMWSVVPV